MAAKNYWLLKTEPTSYSIDDLKKDGTTEWSGVRNYQARNYIRDGMQPGDLALIYHSSSDPTAVVGIAEIVSKAIPDKTALDSSDDHFDPKSTPDNPIWYVVKIKYKRHLKEPLTLKEAKTMKALKTMVLLQKGSRLSIQPVTQSEFEAVIEGR